MFEFLKLIEALLNQGKDSQLEEREAEFTVGGKTTKIKFFFTKTGLLVSMSAVGIPAKEDEDAQLKNLEKDLEAAIEGQDFEACIQIRNAIAAIKKQ